MQKTGSESFISNGVSKDFILQDFWSWHASDLLDNTLRGSLAEFIVAKALGVSVPKESWSAYDYDVPANRKSIYDDVEALKLFGLDIEHQRGKNGGYYIASRDFELPELKLLVDAVQSSRLITKAKSRELIKKISKLASEAQAKQLNRQVHISGRAKTLNETVYYSVDAIHAAINARKKICFRYFDMSPSKRRVYRQDGRAYYRTPVALCWNDDNYYLVAYSHYFDNPLASFRVDRMTDVIILDEPAHKYDKKRFDVTSYIRRNFGMFTGRIEKARLVFDNHLVSVVIDHFGAEIQMIQTSDARFEISAEVSASPVFLSWMFQFGNQAEILEPESLKGAMREMIKMGRAIYGE